MNYYTEKIQIAILNVLNRGATHKRHIVERVLKENPSLIHPKDIRKNIHYLDRLGFIGRKHFDEHIYISIIYWKDIVNSIHQINRFTLKEEASIEKAILQILEKGNFYPLILIEVILHRRKHLNRTMVRKAINSLRRNGEIVWNHQTSKYSLPKTRKSQS